MRELKATGVLRSNNNPVADFAEFLFAETFGWKLAAKSTKGHDALDSAKKRFEIKARRLSNENGSRQLSAIRDLKGHHFDVLAAVLFSDNFLVIRAALIPWEVVVSKSDHVASTNSARIILRDEIWDIAGVEDVTARLQGMLTDPTAI